MIDAGLPLKPLLIRPEGFFDKVTEFFGYADIDFESAEFSRSFFVKSLDKKWAFDVISQKTMEFMLAQPRFTMYFGNPSITVCRNKRLGVKDIETAWGLIAGILDRLPQYLLREFKRG